MRVLVVGSGGREHALVRSLAADPGVTAMHAAPGNPGMAGSAELHDVQPTDPASVIALARRVSADLVVIGPEAPLVAGVADALRDAGISCFGPGRGAAMIEGSKSFAKQVMLAAGVPTAAARTCRSEAEAAEALDALGSPYVVKADGLAAGKGVLVTQDRAAALRHARDCGTVVIEEFLDGPEVSVFAIADGTTAIPLLPAQDFKRAFDGDAGPNTGGMGAYAPLPWAPADLTEQTMAAVVRPALAELSRRGTPYSGLLYTGLSLTARGPRVVEFNARFGDPETQVILDRLATPLGGLLEASARGGLGGGGLGGQADLRWRAGAAVTVVIAAEGYPGSPARGDEITGLAEAGRQSGAYVLHAGTALTAEGALVSSGGRVLNVVGTGDDVGQARAAAYAAASKIAMRGGWYRKDIAARWDAGRASRAVTQEAAAGEGGAGIGPLRVTTLELFFDLVFAFTLTQLAAILDTGPTSGTAGGVLLSVGQVLLAFGLLWWMYEGYAWLTNARPPVHAAERLLLLVGMAGFLIVGLAIPRGFGSDGTALGLGYLLVVVVHAVLYYRVNANIVRVAPFNVASALLVIAAGLAGGAARYPLWAAALVIQLGSPLVVHPRGLFELRPAHLAERHSALLIVALGEAVAAIGIGAAGLHGQPGGTGGVLVTSAVLGLALTAALWWIIFGQNDEAATEQVLASATSERRTTLAVNALFYGNMGVLLGLIAMAAGVEQAIMHSDRPAAGHPVAAAVLAGGGALFLAGDVAIRRLLGTGPTALRGGATVAALATAAAGATVGLDVQVGLLTLLLAAVLVAEWRWDADGEPGHGDTAG